MAPRWHWDFEDIHAPRRPQRPPSPPPPAPAAAAAPGPPERAASFRRRRGIAFFAFAVLVALLVALLSGSGHRRASTRASAARGDAGAAHRAAPKPPSESESDQRAAVASVLAYTPFVKAAGGRAREVALTFDDGPGPYTPQVLSVLERFHVHATFFVIGRMLRYFSASTTRAIEDGDVIGDHTENHPALAQLSAHDQREELLEQIARVELLGAKRPVLFRPPYGSFNSVTMRQLKRLRLLMVLWSVDTGDYLQPGVSPIVERALAGAHPGAIILMHDAGGGRAQTVAALPQIIAGLHSRGYRIVTVPQLLADDPPPSGLPLPASLSGD